jgi:hypothetical protein
MSAELWKSIFDWTTVAAALLTLISGAGALITGHTISKRQEARLRQFDMDLTRAKTDLTNAQLSLARYTAPVYAVPVKGGVATPDLSKGFNQRVVLTADTRIAEPLFPQIAGNNSITWTLFLDQDTRGSHVYAIDAAPDLSPVHGLHPNTRASFEFVTEADGTTSMRGLPVINRPITMAKPTK